MAVARLSQVLGAFVEALAEANDTLAEQPHANLAYVITELDASLTYGRLTLDKGGPVVDLDDQGVEGSGRAIRIRVSPVPLPTPESPQEPQDPEEPGASRFDVVLTSAGNQMIQVIKVVRSLTGLGLKEAKDLVDSAPSVVLEGVGRALAQQAKSALEEAGGAVDLREPDLPDPEEPADIRGRTLPEALRAIARAGLPTDQVIVAFDPTSEEAAGTIVDYTVEKDATRPGGPKFSFVVAGNPPKGGHLRSR